MNLFCNACTFCSRDQHPLEDVIFTTLFTTCKARGESTCGQPIIYYSILMFPYHFSLSFPGYILKNKLNIKFIT